MKQFFIVKLVLSGHSFTEGEGDDEEVSVFLVDSSVLESFHYLYSTPKKRHIYFIIPPTKWMLFHF